MATYNNGNATAVGSYIHRAFGDIVPGSTGGSTGGSTPPTSGQIFPRGH